jgi:hypothetical protein
MKTQIKEEINKLYSLFVKPPKLNVENVKQHIETFAERRSNSKTNTDTIPHTITPLKAAVNAVIRSGRCSWCGASKAKVQDGFRNDLSRNEYQISALWIVSTQDSNSKCWIWS